MIYDLKGAFGTLRRENALYEAQQQHDPLRLSQWNGRSLPMHLAPIPPSPYQLALDQGSDLPVLTPEMVRFWSDYNHVFYHPRSIIQLNEYELNSSLMPFEQWQNGEELFTNLDREHDLVDRDLRPFLEECDQLQGIQIFSNIDDAWGGFTSQYLERMADDLGKGCRWVFGLQDTQRATRERQIFHSLNVARSLYAVELTASMHIPCASLPQSLPSYVTLDDQSRWHTSALQAAAIESITLPSRLRNSQSARATFDTCEATLGGDSKRHLAACAFSVHDHEPAGDGARIHEHVDLRMADGVDSDLANGHSSQNEEKLDIDIFPNFARSHANEGGHSNRTRRSHVFGRVQVRRSNQTSEPSSPDQDNPYPSASGPRTSMHDTQLLFPILSSYPPIFRFSNSTKSVAIRTSLSTSTAVAERVRDVGGLARRFVSIDEREALCDGLSTMADEYEEGWMSDDESDDD